jgi:hypothetical protein
MQHEQTPVPQQLKRTSSGARIDIEMVGYLPG